MKFKAYRKGIVLKFNTKFQKSKAMGDLKIKVH